MKKHEAIYKLYPNVTVIRGDIAYNNDEKEVEYNNEAVEDLIASEAYKDLRAKEYPSIADQLDYIYHNGIDAWKTNMIDPVKNKYPKGVA
jgi:predicted lipoprotein